MVMKKEELSKLPVSTKQHRITEIVLVRVCGDASG